MDPKLILMPSWRRCKETIMSNDDAATNLKPAPRGGRKLVLAAGAVIGLTVLGASAVYSQSGGPGWGGGWGQGGSHGGSYGGNHGGWGHGPMQEGMPRRGWMMGFGPERMIDFALSSVGASSEQKLKMIQIAQGAFNDLRPLRDRRYQLGLKLAILIKADTVDRGAIERLRAEEFAAFEAGSKRAAQAIGDAAEVLTPAQRQQLVERWESRMRR